MRGFLHAPWVINFFLRLSVGLSMVCAGISAYRDFEPFKINVTDGLAALSFFGSMWAYVMPLLLISAGGLLVYGRFPLVTAWLGGIALGCIPFGFMLKTIMSALPLPDMLMAAYPFLVWFLAFYFAMQIPEIPPPTVVKDEED